MADSLIATECVELGRSWCWRLRKRGVGLRRRRRRLCAHRPGRACGSGHRRLRGVSVPRPARSLGCGRSALAGGADGGGRAEGPGRGKRCGPRVVPCPFPQPTRRGPRERRLGAWSRTGRPAGVVSRFPTLRVTWSGGGVEMPVSRDLGGGRSPPRFCKEGGLRPGCPWSGGRVVVPSWVPGSLAGFGKGRTRSELGFLKAFSVGEQNVGAMRTLKQEDLWLFSKLTAVKR